MRAAAPRPATRRSASAETASFPSSKYKPVRRTTRRPRPSRTAAARSTQPAPGVNDRMCASGTKSSQDNASTMRAGRRTSPAPRRHALLLMLSHRTIDSRRRSTATRSPGRHDGGVADRTRLMNNGSTHGPAAASSKPISSHVEHRHRDDAVADLERPIAVVRADGLPDQRGARHGDAHGGHVAKGGEHHDDLRGRAVDRAQPHLHQLKQANPRMSAAISSPIGNPSSSWRSSARACSRVVRCER